MAVGGGDRIRLNKSTHELIGSREEAIGLRTSVCMQMFKWVVRPRQFGFTQT